MKNFVLTDEMISVLGVVSKDKKDSIVKCLTNNWAFIVYPESAPERWIEKLEDFFIPFSISPLHDRDFNADGEPKKPHYHVMLTSDSKKSFSQLVEIAKCVNGTNLINIQSARGYYRYFCHLDNPEKAQYLERDIRHYCGFNPDIYSKPNSLQRYQCIRDMMDFIVCNDITEFWEFSTYCMKNRFDDWFKMLCDNCAVIITNFIKSRRFYKDSLGDLPQDNDIKS